MAQIRDVLDRTTSLCAAVALLATVVVSAVPLSIANASMPLTTRSLEVTSTNPSDEFTNPDGTTYTNSTYNAKDPRNGFKVGHKYTFTAGSTATMQSLSISYCDGPFGYVTTGFPGGCTLPTGFDAALAPSAVVTNVTAAPGTPKTFTVGTAWSAVNKLLKLTNGTGGVAMTAGDVITVDFTANTTNTNYFTNPNIAYKNDVNKRGTYFAHITTFSDAAYTTALDEGTVASNVANSINIYTRVQETLKFSVGTDGSNVDPSTTCAPLSNTILYLGDTNKALSTQTAYDAYSYFRLSTNSAHGTKVMYSGDTLKSGSQDINAIGAAFVNSTLGTEQFGLAIDNTAGSIGAGFGYTMSNLVAAAPYAAGNGTISDSTPANNAKFAFDATSLTTPVTLASSGGIVNCETGAVRYVANIANDTPAGIYQTKINYIAAPAY